jgi:ubiquinone biosynthesis protein Coq4
MTKQRRENIQINKIRGEKGDIDTNTNKILTIIKDYCENLYSSELENLDEMDKFVHAYNQPRLNQENIKHLNSSITGNQIEAVIKSLSTKKRPGQS